MALIPLEGLGAQSQKTSLLGGVAQILIYPGPSPRLADVGLFVRSKSQQMIISNLGKAWNGKVILTLASILAQRQYDLSLSLG